MGWRTQRHCQYTTSSTTLRPHKSLHKPTAILSKPSELQQYKETQFTMSLPKTFSLKAVDGTSIDIPSVGYGTWGTGMISNHKVERFPANCECRGKRMGEESHLGGIKGWLQTSRLCMDVRCTFLTFCLIFERKIHCQKYIFQQSLIASNTGRSGDW